MAVHANASGLPLEAEPLQALLQRFVIPKVPVDFTVSVIKNNVYKTVFAHIPSYFLIFNRLSTRR
jgi:hypothetical protein